MNPDRASAVESRPAGIEIQPDLASLGDEMGLLTFGQPNSCRSSTRDIVFDKLEDELLYQLKFGPQCPSQLHIDNMLGASMAQILTTLADLEERGRVQKSQHLDRGRTFTDKETPWELV